MGRNKGREMLKTFSDSSPDGRIVGERREKDLEG